MPSLYGPVPPTWTVPQPILDRQRPTQVRQLVTWRFNPFTGDFDRDEPGRATVASPVETTLLWGARAASIQRAGYPIFSRSFGVGFRRILRAGGPRRVVEQALEADIRRATGPGPSGGRIRSADSFTFNWPGHDVLEVRYTLTLAEGSRYRGLVRISLRPPAGPPPPPPPPALGLQWDVHEAGGPSIWIDVEGGWSSGVVGLYWDNGDSQWIDVTGGWS